MTRSDEEQLSPDIQNHTADEAVPSQPLRHSIKKVRQGLFITLAGFVVFLLGARPSIYGLDRSPVIGFVQIAVFLFGMGIICFGAFTTFQGLWQGKPSSILSQIGMRTMQTGFVIALFTGLADVFGLGSHQLPRTFFGPLQAIGVQIGEIVIGTGIILMFPFHRFITTKKFFPPKNDQDLENSEYQ
jgi:hypothetical protein